MIIVIVIGFYTSRLAINWLGAESYGIYGALFSLTIMLSLFGNSLPMTVSRFITFELGKDDSQSLKDTFQNSLFLFLCAALIMTLLSETIGMYFVNRKLLIPKDKLFLANIAFQFCVLGQIFRIILTPYQSLILAHERMSIYSLVNVLEVAAKLLLLAILVYAPTVNALVFYTALMCFLSGFVFISFLAYCLKNFKESVILPHFNERSIKPMLKFYFADSYSAISATAQTYGVNVLQNLFFGPLANAASTIANQVMSGIGSLSDCFLSAVRPQIVKRFAAGQKEDFIKLIVYGSEMSAILILILALPAFIETDFLLFVWLKQIPQYSVVFTKLVLISCVFSIFFNTVINSIIATAKIGKISFASGTINLLIFFATWIMYKYGLPAHYCYTALICGNIIYNIIALILAAKLFDNFKVLYFLKEAVLKPAIFASISGIAAYHIHSQMPFGFTRLLFVCAIIFCLMGLLVSFFSFTKELRREFYKKLLFKLKSLINKKPDNFLS